MPDILSPVFWLIITLGILVTVHEWGHFIVARWCGVHIERFSVGFGRALFKRTGKNGTEYQIAIIPLGGYVKMLDEREQAVAPERQAMAFNRQSLRKRFAIVAAGPFANLLLCVLLLWAAMVIGTPGLRPLLGPSQGLAQEAGFVVGDELRSIDGQPVQTWNDALPALALAAMDHRALAIEVQAMDGSQQRRILPLHKLAKNYKQTELLEEIGFTPFFAVPSAYVGTVLANGPAYGVLLAGDRITAINGKPVSAFGDIPAILAEHQSASAHNVQVDVERNGTPMSFLIAPVATDVEGVKVWRIGIGNVAATKIVQFPFWQALPEAAVKTWGMATDSFAVIKRLLTGKASMDNLSSPIGIAQAADNQAGWGISAFLSFLAAISLALCIMNLLPIPVLDGGHLLYFAIEGLTGKPLTDSAQAIGQMIGAAMLVGLLSIAIFNDFFRIIS